MNLAEALLTALRDHGAGQVFGIPGDFVLAFFKVVEESGILPLYTLSHEPSVGFAADAAARFEGAPGVAAGCTCRSPRPSWGEACSQAPTCR